MITPFQFQEAAAAQIAKRVSEYLDEPVTVGRKQNKHTVPFFQALSSLTGSGKTIVLAAAVAHIANDFPVAPVILWLSKGKVVVSQTFMNLSPGGKYHQLLGSMTVLALADYSPEDVSTSDRPLVYLATVGTFAQKDKEEGTLRIYKSDVDTMESSTWDALAQRIDSEGRRRPLIVVYDEGQNLSDLQTDLLLDLEPDVFLPASATMKIPPRLDREVQSLKNSDWTEDELVTKIPTAEVVAAGLVKSTVLLEGYNSPMEETVSTLLASWRETEREADAYEAGFRPKAIYVCDTNVVADTPNQTENPRTPFLQRQAPPILIWRYLTEQEGIDPATVAVYSNLKVDKEHPLPEEFVLFSGADSDYADFIEGDFQHIIFNLTLQEGWDDPAVYFAYIDKSMGSKAQITQIIGRVLRQPGATRYPSDLLNTAHFFVRVDRNDVFSQVIAEVENELGNEPGGIRIAVSAPGSPSVESYLPRFDVQIPETGIESSHALQRVQDLMSGFPNFRDDSKNTKGEGSRRIVRQVVGASNGPKSNEWESFEQSSTASARWVFHREVQRQLASALGVVNLADPNLDAVVGIGSPAYLTVCKLAEDVVDTFVKNVRLTQRRANPYKVGALIARPDQVEEFKNSVHTGYAGLLPDEGRFARCLDDTGIVWARNPARSGYGIPLITPGPTTMFYPDFIFWTDDRVVCVDTKGAHLVQETARRKLLRVNYAGEGPRLDIRFVSTGRYNDDLELRDRDGHTSWSLADDGRFVANHYEELSDLIKFVADDSLNLV